MSKAEGEALARRYKMPFFETSAKKDIGVTEAFTEIARLVVAREGREGGPADKPKGS